MRLFHSTANSLCVGGALYSWVPRPPSKAWHQAVLGSSLGIEYPLWSSPTLSQIASWPLTDFPSHSPLLSAHVPLKAWPPPHSLEGSPKIQRERICLPPHPPIPQALLRNFRARRDLDLERGTLSPSGSATEQCDFGRVAFPFWALLSTSVKWE